ncbi:MAP7 domain-containing protein 3 isoform X3 [Hylobates moloch]|uniref:MAP7 domain-containing protein 3 isoform X3 n=1 Tax=Hylobates moloch TaxID=81572 RepID=UPI0013F22B32|nr:MAP7 domain-containing protein 3 isoform X3 [Hylobates moloch]
MMADGAAAGAGGSPSLRELRARMVAAANEIAKERRKQCVVNRVATHSSNIRSTFKPVIDGSMLKNDIKQRLARERREEKRRQQDANKETQLLEKERKTKLQYEKQMEERQRKLKERKEKEEQRRIAAEEKRHQKDEAQKEKFTAILYRTLERRRLADDYQQKRWSWGGSAMANSESKTANKRSASTEKLEQGTSALIRQMPLSSAGLQNSVAKRKTDERSSSLNRRDSNLHSSADKEQAERKPRVTGVTNYVMRYVTVPLRKCTSDELRAVMFPMSTMKIPPQTKVEEAPLEKVETPPKASVDAPPQVNVEVFCNTSMEASPKASVGTVPEVSTDSSPVVSVDVSPVVSTYDSEMSMDASPELSIEALPKVHLETVPKVSIEASPEVSLEAPPEVSVEAAPEASVESPPEASLEAPPEVSLEALPEVSVEAAPEGSLEAPPKGSTEVAPKESVKGSPKESMEASPEAMVKASPETSLKSSMEASPKAKARDAPKKSEMDKQALIPIAKKHLSSYTEYYKWSSSPANVCGLPSPISTNRQIQKNRPPSPLPLISKQSPQTSFPYKIMPIQHTLSVQSASSTVKKKKETVSKTTNRCEALSQRHMIYEESGNKSTAGIMNAEAATKILTELRRLAREQREKEEEEIQREEMQRRVIKKSKDMAKEAVGGQAEDHLKLKDGQRQKETKKKKGWLDQEDQEAPLQKRDAKIKAQEEADKRKKEHERIMLQNLQERLERKKRIEEIMKRTRKTDVNASKVAETSSHDIYEEAEADNEESDKDSLNEMFPSAILNDTGSPTKFKIPFNNAKKMTHKLVFLEDGTSQVREEPKTYFNGDLKNFRQKSMKDTSIQEVVSRPSSKRMTSHTTKTRKADETNTTSRSSAQTNSEGFHDISPKSPDTFRR